MIGTLLRALPLEWVGTRTQRREMLWQHSRGSNSIIIGKQRVTGNLEENELSVRLMEPDVNWSRSSSSFLLFLLLLRLFILLLRLLLSSALDLTSHSHLNSSPCPSLLSVFPYEDLSTHELCVIQLCHRSLCLLWCAELNQPAAWRQVRGVQKVR